MISAQWIANSVAEVESVNNVLRAIHLILMEPVKGANSLVTPAKLEILADACHASSPSQ